MIDFILGLFLAGMLVRGWMRGLVREALDLVGLVLGLVVAFRLSRPLGEFLTDRFGVGPEVAGIGAGIALFLLFGIATSIAAHYLTRVMSLPGLNLANRLGGAALATAWGIAVVLVVVSVARVLPLTEGWEDDLEGSRVVGLIAGPDALPQRIFEGLASDVLGSVASLQDLFGSSRAVPEGTEVLTVPAAAGDEVRQVRDETSRILELVNEYRAGQGLRALGRSTALEQVAERRGITMYTTGRISRDTPPGGGVADDLRAEGVRLALAGENLALASSARAGLDAMLESPSALAQFNVADYDRAGLAVVDGPTGRLLVIVMGG